jgi:hypothetical protein
MPEKRTLERARRAGVELRPPRKGKTSNTTRHRAARDYAVAHGAPKHKRTSTATRSRASLRAMKRERTDTVDHAALASQARSASSACAGRLPDAHCTWPSWGAMRAVSHRAEIELQVPFNDKKRIASSSR